MISLPAFAGDVEQLTQKDVLEMSMQEFLDLSEEQIDALLRSGVTNLCLREGTPGVYLYFWNLQVVGSAPGGVLILDGFLSSTDLPVNWDVSGSYTKPSSSIELTAVNPAPDFCTFYSDEFTSNGNNIGQNFSGTWVNNCGLNGTWTGIGRVGICPSPRLGAPGKLAGGAALARQPEPAAQVSVFPNPAAQQVFIDLSAYAGQEVDVQVFDASGRMLSNLFNGLADYSVVSWDLNGLTNGLYLVRVMTNDSAESIPVSVNR